MRREFIIVKKLICILLLAALLLAPTAFAKGCKHENTELRNAETGTCCEPGYSGDLYCLDCNTVLIPGHATENGPHMLYEEPKGYRESTCTMHGFAGNFYCSECGGLIVKGEILPMLEHVPGSTGEAEEPDCDDEGCTAYTNCLHCYQTFEGREPIPALGHDFSEVYETVEATCRSEGFISGYCARCEYDREEDIAQLEHDYVDNVCTGCGYYLPGLYDNDGNLVKTWEQLCEDGDIYFEKYRDYGEYRIEYESVYLGLTGQLVLPDDADLYSRLLAGSQLTSLWFGQNADYIYELSDCPNLEKIYLYCKDGVELDDDSIFNNPSLKEIIVAEGSSVGIGVDAFSGCPNLEKIVLPSDISGCWISSGFIPGENLTFCFPGTEEAWIERYGEDHGFNVIFNYTEA